MSLQTSLSTVLLLFPGEEAYEHATHLTGACETGVSPSITEAIKKLSSEQSVHASQQPGHAPCPPSPSPDWLLRLHLTWSHHGFVLSHLCQPRMGRAKHSPACSKFRGIFFKGALFP